MPDLKTAGKNAAISVAVPLLGLSMLPRQHNISGEHNSCMAYQGIVRATLELLTGYDEFRKVFGKYSFGGGRHKNRTSRWRRFSQRFNIGHEVEFEYKKKYIEH